MNHLLISPALACKPAGVSRIGLHCLLLSVMPFLVSSPVSAQAPSLGTAMDFAVLSATTVTNTGTSSITGDVGVAPGTALTGFPPGIVTGSMHPGDAIAARAQGHATVAYNALAGAACTSNLTGQDLGGLTLTPGVFCFSSSAQLTGGLTLDALGNSSAVFIFQIGSTLTTASGSTVNLLNGASACNVFWQVGSSATLGSTTAFAGNVIALASITLANGATVSGRALARTGAVTMDTCNVVIPQGTSLASWNNYGTGWPGSGGVIPSLTLSAQPVLGTSPDVVVQNVRGPATFGCLFWGTGPVNIPTLYGGSLQVLMVYEWPTPLITPGSLAMRMPIPLDPQLNCMTYDLQVVEFDEGASHFVAFTRGLHMVLGL